MGRGVRSSEEEETPGRQEGGATGWEGLPDGEVFRARGGGGDSGANEGQHPARARVLGAEGESRWEPREAGATGSLGGRSRLCALRVRSVLHNQGKLLKWGEPEGEEGWRRKGEGSAAPPP